jgi:hypothetical protein
MNTDDKKHEDAIGDAIQRSADLPRAVQPREPLKLEDALKGLEELKARLRAAGAEVWTFDDAIELVDAEERRLEASPEFVDYHERAQHYSAVGAFLKEARAKGFRIVPSEETQP